MPREEEKEVTSGQNVTVYEDKQTKVQTSGELVRNQFALDACFCRNPTILHANGNHLCRRSCSLLETSWMKMRVVPGFVNQNAKALGRRLDATTTSRGSDVSAASRPVTRSHCIFYLHHKQKALISSRRLHLPWSFHSLVCL